MVIFKNVLALHEYILNSEYKDTEFIDDSSGEIPQQINNYFKFKHNDNDIWITLLTKVLMNNANIYLAKFLVESGSNLNEKCTADGFYLIQTPIFKHIEIAEYLICRGFKLNIDIPVRYERDSTGYTEKILHRACRMFSEYDILKFLVDHGADRNYRETKYGQTPIIVYIRSYCFTNEWYWFHSETHFEHAIPIFELLMTKENIRITDNFGKSANSIINNFNDNVLKQKLRELIERIER